MAKVWMENKAAWLFDLSHGNLDDDAIVKGFLKHYVLRGQGICDVKQELHFHMQYGDFYMEAAISNLRRALETQIEAPDRSALSARRGKRTFKGGSTWKH